MSLLSEEMFVLFAILALGSWLGQLNWRGVSLGSAGVLFAALAFGHFGYSVPREVMDLGLLLFVYAVGLTAGPSFFRTFRRRGLQFAGLAALIALSGALLSGLAALGLGLSPALAAGLYAGALTCTPALAAALDSLNRLQPASASLASVGYGVAYPFSMVGNVLLVQFLPALLKRPVKREEEAWLEEKSREAPGLAARQFIVRNPNCEGRSVSSLNPHRLAQVNLSRIKHNEQVCAATAETILHLGDVVMAVGVSEELDKLRLLLGEETETHMDVNGQVMNADVDVLDESLTGKTLAQMRVWEQFTLVITRIRRQGLEISPNGSVTLEMGDNIRVVGEKNAVQAFVRRAQGSPRKANETNMLPYLAGLLAGIGLGLLPIPLGNGVSVKPGMAGGAFLTSLLLGHFGKVGPFRLYVPLGAKNLSRELGLMLFLAGAGTTAGAKLAGVLQAQGLILLLSGAAITSLSALVGLWAATRLLKLNLLSAMGAITASMTNPPALAAASNQTETDLPALAYASAYPAALLFKILLAQLLVEILQRLT